MELDYRIAVLNHPAAPEAVEWNEHAMSALIALGFDTVQLNVAWGARPADEPLNLEDILGPVEGAGVTPQVLLPASLPGREGERLAKMRNRLEIARSAGLRTVFHFGAPFNEHAAHGGNPPNCVSDPGVIARYERLLDSLHAQLPVDDIFLYTFDQDAWVCSELGECPRCAGVPLHERLVPFLERLAARWSANSAGGRMWWEPWELSAGQTVKIISEVEPAGLGLALHNNFAEVMVSRAVDQHVRNTALAASRRGIPVVIEGFFGAATEEVEPFVRLQSPATTYRQVRRMVSVEGVTGVKEYYGVDTSWADPNLLAASAALSGEEVSESELLRSLSDGYGPGAVRRDVEEVWRLASEAMDLYPWDASWFVREVGRSDPEHSLNAAFIRGFCADTPSWRSSRGSSFIAVTDAEAHPWLLEDLQLRWESCAQRQEQAVALGRTIPASSLGAHEEGFGRFIDELAEFARRARAFALHCRETSLAHQLRAEPAPGVRARLLERLKATLEADRDNMGTDLLTPLIEELDRDPGEFLSRWFLPTQAAPDPRRHVMDPVFPAPNGYFSATSR